MDSIKIGLLCSLCVAMLGCDTGAKSSIQPLAAVPSTIADDGTFVIDKAGVIDASTKETLNKQLRGLEAKNGSQVKVLTIESTNGEDIIAYSQRTATSWALGQKGKNNGVLVVLAVKDRKIRVQTGYGMEETLPDSYLGTLSRDTAKAYFKNKQYGQGIGHIVNEVVVKLSR